MVIWRGLGFLAFLLAVAGAMAGVFIGVGITGADDPPGYFPGLGLVIGGAGTVALGWWLNVTRPAEKTSEWIAQRHQQLQVAVASGRFQPSPGIVPSSYQEAQMQADALLAAEAAHVTKRLRNIHTLFWIPMQWAGLVVAAIGLVVTVNGLTATSV